MRKNRKIEKVLCLANNVSIRPNSAKNVTIDLNGQQHSAVNMNQLFVGYRSRRRADAVIGLLCRVNDPAHPSATDWPAKTNNTYTLKPASTADLYVLSTVYFPFPFIVW